MFEFVFFNQKLQTFDGFVYDGDFLVIQTEVEIRNYFSQMDFLFTNKVPDKLELFGQLHHDRMFVIFKFFEKREKNLPCFQYSEILSYLMQVLHCFYSFLQIFGLKIF